MCIKVNVCSSFFNVICCLSTIYSPNFTIHVHNFFYQVNNSTIKFNKMGCNSTKSHKFNDEKFSIIIPFIPMLNLTILFFATI